MDVEPIATFRGHTDTVLSLCIHDVQDANSSSTPGADEAPPTYRVYSGSLDGTVKSWNLPPADVDPYCSYG